jgi:hypothetical protein
LTVDGGVSEQIGDDARLGQSDREFSYGQDDRIVDAQKAVGGRAHDLDAGGAG